MDLEDEGWVNIPYDEFLEVHDDGDEKIFSRKYVKSPTKHLRTDYFNTPQESQNFVEDEPRFPKQLIPFPIQLDHGDEVKEITKLPILINDEPKETTLELGAQDQDPIFQVFFKKENEFVEMKMDSPISNSRGTNLSHIETDHFQYEEKSDDHMVNHSSPSKVTKEEEEVAWVESNERLNFWKWGLSGIGAFCSLGMAAATICIIIFGNGKKHNHHNQTLGAQIYSDNKRIKQVVHHASEAMSTMRGVPLAKAQITYGGHYEGL